MRRIPALTAVLTTTLTAAAFAAAVPSASADEQPSFSTTPSPARAGQSVILSVSGGCDSAGAVASSDAFTSSVTLSTGSAGIWTGTATVRSDAAAGRYDVDVSCQGGGVSTYSMTVTGAVTPTPTRPVPTQGVRAGVGGSQGGADLGRLGGGAALVVAAGGYMWLRTRRGRERRH
ncbi:hypothetical protein [Streptomyces beihaiensis]|uniref:Uncharacterized protein n=1 Tax=Streptomyces beihaiensis TaxID=2984495 RepID=A0ABT3TMM3_9ACTN|nr:hypothetical protein [Streptomyces beihaiensis]MCX3058256.1 hypothetical protein [Streptomyces beihaiensis]